MTTNPGSGDAINMFFHKGSQEFFSGTITLILVKTRLVIISIIIIIVFVYYK